ncbi:MAG TPA: PorV/PorQ family protein [Bacteroidota bacterium]
MKRKIPLLVFSAILIGGLCSAQQKLAQTGMKFLNYGTDPRAVALGEAVTSIEWSSTALFYNPATMARLDATGSLAAGSTRWIADINYYYASLAIAPFGQDIGIFGFTVQSVDYGEIQETILSGNERGFLDVGSFKPTGLALGVGYARALSDKFSVGGQVKLVFQNLGSGVTDIVNGEYVRQGFKQDVPAFDFGILYRTGYKSLNFGMTVRNFATEVTYVEESFQLPLTFKIGVSMNMFDLTSLDHEYHSLLLAFDAEHPRDFPEQIRLGLEYEFAQTLALRAGIVTPNDEYNYSLGLGLHRNMAGVILGVDYSFTIMDHFNDVHRFALQIGL